MKLRSLLVAASSVAVLALTAFAAEINLEKVKCAMNPKAAAKAAKFVDYKGGQVFFCCDNCPKGFAKGIKAKDKLVAAKGNHQLVVTHQAKQSKCPLTGRASKAATAIEVAGAKIAFCCENCQGKAKKMDAKDQLAQLFSDAAFKKAGFKVEHTSEGVDDPEKRDAEADDDSNSEGADDPAN
jgi:hypothetical protein